MIDVELGDDLEIRSFFENLLLNDSNSAKIYSQFGESAVENTRDRFLDGEDPSGQPWVISGRAREQSGTTLRDTSNLYNSFDYVVERDGVRWGTPVVYAKWLHHGVVIYPNQGKYLTFKGPAGNWVNVKKVEIPARPILGVSEQDKKDFVRILTKELKPR